MVIYTTVLKPEIFHGVNHFCTCERISLESFCFKQMCPFEKAHTRNTYQRKDREIGSMQYHTNRSGREKMFVLDDRGRHLPEQEVDLHVTVRQ